MRLFRGNLLFLLILLVLIFYIFSNIVYIYKLVETNDDDEKYLAYLPHSGLSNQRIELSNALLLSYMLNRTLIIPPAFLGNVFGWMERDDLVKKMNFLTNSKQVYYKCLKAKYVKYSKCNELAEIGIINWIELHDLNLLNDIGIKFTLQYKIDQFKSDQVYYYNDSKLYDWKLYENYTQAKSILDNKLNHFDSFNGRTFYKILLLNHFKQRKEKLLYLGSVFGSTRIVLSPNSKYLRVQKKIKHTLHYRLDTKLGQTTKSIIDYLGGPHSYNSIHFRTADHPFKKDVKKNLKYFKNNINTLGDDCLNIYMATDHKSPRSNWSQLVDWFESFPCTTILNDLPNELLEPLDSIKDIVTYKSLRRFLIPIVDSIIAAHGKTILTTPRSTFSKYIEELHEVFLLNDSFKFSGIT